MTDNELNALVAEKVLGWKRIRERFTVPEEELEEGDCAAGWTTSLVIPSGEELVIADEWDNGVILWFPDKLEIERHLPDYCNDIAAAWQVVEKIHKILGWIVTLEMLTDDYIECHLEKDYTGDGDRVKKWACSDSPARAICLAALEAVKTN